MSVELSITLPWPPSVNGYWVSGVNINTKRPMKYLSEKAREFRRDVTVEANQRWRRKPMTGSVWMHHLFYPPDRRTRDLDNYKKGLWDALRFARIYKDDSQIIADFSRMMTPIAGGKVVLTLGEFIDAELGLQESLF